MIKILIVIADFYDDIAMKLLEGAKYRLDQEGIVHEVIRVPGALEIPPAIAMAAESEVYAGYVALGCVIRGETSHYDTVCNESARGLMDLGIYGNLAIGNGIITVENHEQAYKRANISMSNKGGGAAEALISLLKIKGRFDSESKTQGVQ